MITLKTSKELTFAYLVNKKLLDANCPKEYLKEKNIQSIQQLPDFKKWKYNKNNLDKYLEIMQKELEKFDFKQLKKVEKFFDEKFPKEIEIFICTGNSTNATFGKNNYSFYLLLPRGFPDKMTPKRDFRIVIHELIHSLHYKKEIESLVPEAIRRELFEYVVRCFAPDGILFGGTPQSQNPQLMKQVMTVVKNNKRLRECMPQLIGLFVK